MRKVRTGISREEEEKIVGYILDGMNCNKIAKLMKRDRGVVKRIAKKHSVELIKNMKHAVIPEVLDCIPKYSRYVESTKRQALISNMMRSMPLRFRVECLWNILFKKCGISNQPVTASAMIRVFPSLEHSTDYVRKPTDNFRTFVCPLLAPMNKT